MSFVYIIGITYHTSNNSVVYVHGIVLIY